MPLLRSWETFYMIVGSAAAALTGLQFVVMALGAQIRASHDPASVEAFGTPTIVHFCAVLTVAALMVMPGHTPPTLSLALALPGAAGLVYAVIVAFRARRQTGYAPVFEDWLWHAALPVATYAALGATGIAALWHVNGAMYVVAAIELLLLFIGIHNAWDAAVYMATRG